MTENPLEEEVIVSIESDSDDSEATDSTKDDASMEQEKNTSQQIKPFTPNNNNEFNTITPPSFKMVLLQEKPSTINNKVPSVDFKTLLQELNTGEWGDRPKQFIRMEPLKCDEPVLIGFLLRSHWTMTTTKDLTDFHMLNGGL